MSGAKFTDEFKRDAVAQVEDRSYPVREVAERLGVSTKSIYTWQKQFSRPAKVIQEVDAQADEIRHLKRDLARVTDERDILKKATAYFARESSSRGLQANRCRAAGAVCVRCRTPADICGPARQDVFDYIEFFYNPQRKHVRNGMLSLIAFEQQQKLKLQGV